MTESRSASQILFGYLPDQTVDVRGGVWKVKSWRVPHDERNIDVEALRRELCRLAAPWQASGRDGGFVQDLLTSRARVKVQSLDRDRGVELEPFPRIWICSGCGRLYNSPDAKCLCGSSGRKGQLHFVGYCEQCGDICEPWIPQCPTHRQCKIVFPGTASGSEIVFSCPSCNVQLRRGFGFPSCRCGGRFTFNVHRAASVYTPRSVVIVNPPSPERMRQIDEAGGGPRALSWVLDGMVELSMVAARPDEASLRRQLAAQGLAATVIESMLNAAKSAGGLSTGSADLGLPTGVPEEAENQAVTVALALSESRTRAEDLIASVEPQSELGILYRGRYPEAIAEAGLERVELIDKFPVLTGQYGYTRGSFEPGASRLRAYRERSGDYIVYGDIGETEALFVRLLPTRVAKWLTVRGYTLESWTDGRTAHIAILKACANGAAEDILGLIHSYAHRLIRLTAVHAGIERNSLSELLVPLNLGFFLYAAARGDFVLGGLQAVIETELHRFLREFVRGEHRCALDPGCSQGGGACVACLHLGEPSCRLFNTKLDRAMLTGHQGYLAATVFRNRVQ